MIRIASGGFHTESCTFSPLITREEDFFVLRGNALRRNYDFVSQYEGIDFVPIVRARALPGGPVDKSFYYAIKEEFLSGLKDCGPWDGVFLHMHGAANVVGMDDAEGDWVASAREVVGQDCLIAASYDLHGNVSRTVFENIDLLSAYRTAPHIDWYETIQRTFGLLVNCVRAKTRPLKAFIPIPILLPGEQTSTEWEPAASLYKLLPDIIAQEGVLDATILIGYVWADEPRASASVLAFGLEQNAVNRAATILAQRFWDARHEFHFGAYAAPVDECIRLALESPEQPVIISDSGDNPTAGGAGDVPCVLERLLEHRVPDAVYASIADPAAVVVCQSAGVGTEVELSLGGKLDPINGSPLSLKGRVLSLAEQVPEIYDAGAEPLKNAIAAVQVEGIQVIITARRTVFHRIADYQRLGINPGEHKIIVVKIGYLEPELKQLAAKNLLALSPGAVNQDIESLPFKRIQRPVFPLDRNTVWVAPSLR
jgi:microcystin degradation protein MlrC